MPTERSWFKSIRSHQGATKRWRELAKKYHPDVGGNHEIMAEINRQYQQVIERLARPKSKKQAATTTTTAHNSAPADGQEDDPASSSQPPDPLFDDDEYGEVVDLVADITSRFIKAGVRAFARRRRAAR